MGFDFPGVQSRGCLVCGSFEALEIHHVDWNHANNRQDNVARLCRRCHVLVHQCGFVSLEELRAIADQVRARRGLIG